VNRRFAWIGILVAAFIMSGPLVGWTQEEPQGQPEEAPIGEEVAPQDQPIAEAPSAPVSESPPAALEEAQAGLISVDFKDADIRQVLRILSLKSGVDIVASPDVEGLVTIKLTNVPWEQALDIILRTYGFTYERKGNVVRVLTLEAMEQEALATEVFPLSYAKAKEVTDVIKEMLSDRGKVKFDERTNTLVITDLPSNLFQLKQVIERLDQQTPQVHIESKFVETRLTRDENLGIDWFDSIQVTVDPAIAPTTFPFPAGKDLGNVGEAFLPRAGTFDPSTGASLPRGRVPGVGGKFTFGTIDTANLVTTLNVLKQRIDTRVISNPTIVTLNNKEAFVQVGTDVNIPNFQIDPSTGRATVTGFQTRSTGVILKITPQVNPQQEIVLAVKPEITTVGADRTFASGITFPDFDVQKADTQVRLRDGETLAIGGMKRNAERVTLNKVPILGDIPIIGWLFTNRREQTPSGQDQLDLLIFMTVHLVKDQPEQQAAMATPEMSFISP